MSEQSPNSPVSPLPSGSHYSNTPSLHYSVLGTIHGVESLSGIRMQSTWGLERVSVAARGEVGGRGGGGGAPGGRVPAGGPDPQLEMLRGMLEEPLRGALASLRWEFRIGVGLCGVQGLFYGGAGGAGGCRVGTVRSRLHRG